MRPFRQHRAFTLVELLVVIGVITILAALLLPALTGATSQAKTASCISNLSQLAKAAVTYHGNFGFQFPSPAHTNTASSGGDQLNDEQYWDGDKVDEEYISYTWKGKLRNYIGSREDMDEDSVYKVMKCPAVRLFNGHKSFYGSNAYVTMHYGLEDGTPEELVRFGKMKALHFDQIEDHTNTFMFGENNTGHWAVRPEVPREPTDFTAATEQAMLYTRHDKRSTWVFFDGSAKALTKEDAQARECILWLGIKPRAPKTEP
jgi:prepilin-type N-terminal cleavage/methylation domain-containing protein